MSLKTKVVINGTTVKDSSSETDPSQLIEFEYERLRNGGVSEISIKLLASSYDLVNPIVGKAVNIWTGVITSTDKKIFSGYISESQPDGGYINLICKDKLWDLVRRNVNNVYLSSGAQGGQISEIATDLIETYGGLNSSVQATGTAATEILEEFRCDSTDVFERLNVLAKAVNYQVFYDAVNDTVHFEQEGFGDNGKTLTVGSEINSIPKWTTDTSKMVNDLRVDGAVVQTQIRKPIGSGTATIGTTAGFETTHILLDKTPESVELILDSSNPPITVREGGTKDASTSHYYYIDKQNKKLMPKTGTTFPAENVIVNYTWFAPAPIHQINQDSIDTYGKWEKTTTLSDIRSIADAEVRTAEILSKFSSPFLLGEFLINASVGQDLDVGDKVIVFDSISNPNINQSFVITKQLIKYPGANQEITVGDEALKLADWQLDVEDRLKRIEESLTLQNQDLILELFDFQNDITVEPRYIHVMTSNIAGDTMIWGSSDFGVWGTSKWGDTSSISFVLGNSSAAILGTSKLGSVLSSNVTHFVEQYNNDYIEEFQDEDFKGETTADWTVSGLVFN